MTQKYFKVRNGLTVGEDATTIDATTGNIVTNGNLTLNNDAALVNSVITAKYGTDTSTLKWGPSSGGNKQWTFNDNVYIQQTTATTNATVIPLALDGRCTSAPAIGFSTNLDYVISNNATNNSVLVGRLGLNLTDNTVGAEEAVMQFGVVENGAVATKAELEWNGDFTAFNDLQARGDILANEDQTNVDSGLYAYKGAAQGSLLWNGTEWTATGGINSGGGTFGNITVGVATDNTISTTTGNLDIDSATNQINLNGAVYTESNLTVNTGVVTTNSGTVSLFDTTATNVDAFGAATVVDIGAAGGVTNFNGTIDVKGGTITDSTGALTISTGAANGNITLDPNGTGDVVLTLADGGNLVNSRNYVFGAIRNATTESNGDIWALNASSNTTPTRGISIDNSADTAKTASYLARTYGTTPAARSRIILERARGTAASPAAVQGGDLLGEIDATGYSSTGWINDTVTAVPGFFGFTAAENWVSNTNLGTSFALNLAPTATTITSGNNLVTTILSTPQINYLKGDRFAAAQGKTTAFTATGCSTSGTTLTIGTLSSGTIAVGQGLSFTTTAASGIYIVANISGSGSGSTWQLSESPGTLSGQTVLGHAGFIGGTTAATTVDALQDLRLLKNVIKASDSTTALTLVPVTGQAPNTLVNGNLVHDVIRDATTEANGDIWSMQSGAANAVRGLSIDNTDNTGKRPGVALRAYGGSTLRGFIVGELARGSVATPTAVQSGNTVLELAGSGYNGTQWVTDATGVTVAPISISLQAAENWTSPAGVNTANGARLRVDAQPIGVTATGLTRSNIINHTPTTATYRADAWTFATREVAAGGTNTTQLTLDSSGNAVLTGDLRINGNDILSSSGATVMSMITNDAIFADVVQVNGQIRARAGLAYDMLTTQVVGTGASAENVLNLTKSDASSAANQSVIDFSTYRSTAGTYSPTQSGDKLGQFKFNGNTSSTTTPSPGTNPAVSITGLATELWTSTNTGAKLLIGAVKNGGTASVNIIDHSPTAATYKTDSLTLQDSANVNLVGNKITYNRVYGQFEYGTTVTPAAANTAYVFPLGTATFNNIASVANTSQLVIGAAGIYNFQFSVQCENSDNSNDHEFYIWIRKNGTDVPGSTGRMTVPKSNTGSLKIVGWNFVVDSANATDYYELAYAVSNTAVTFPAFGALAFAPGTSSLVTTITPVGA